jgi:hypothetical protein
LSTTAAPDPYFNPPFFNDVQFRDRGWFRNIAHFTKKHMDENLVSAATSHIMSHLEFGGCLADYPGLLARYNKLRQLEDVDPVSAQVPPGAPRPTKVRFVNYFTISTGRITKPKSRSPSPHLKPETALSNVTTSHGSAGSSGNLLEARVTNTTQASGRRSPRNSFEANSGPATPRISIEDHSDGGRPEILQLIDPVPEEEMDDQSFHSAEETPVAPSDPITAHPAPSTSASLAPVASPPPIDLHLPAVPDLPPPPPAPDLEHYASNPAARKLAEKEYKQAKKAFDQAVKNRDKAIAERAKLIKKHHQKVAKEAEKQKKADEKRERDEQKRMQKEQAAALKRDAEDAARRGKEAQAAGKDGVAAQQQQQQKKKERKFCMLPRKVNGVRDTAWVQVYMEGVDEVGAHCGLFFQGPHYERLVGDVGARIVGWVQEDASRRAVMELEAGLEDLDVD